MSLLNDLKKKATNGAEKQAKSELGRKAMNELDKHARKGVEKQAKKELKKIFKI
jgi:hypothetical protein